MMVITSHFKDELLSLKKYYYARCIDLCVTALLSHKFTPVSDNWQTTSIECFQQALDSSSPGEIQANQNLRFFSNKWKIPQNLIRSIKCIKSISHRKFSRLCSLIAYSSNSAAKKYTDCGIFAIAYAIEILHGSSSLDTTLMRKLLLVCLQLEKFSKQKFSMANKRFSSFTFLCILHLFGSLLS